METLQTAPVARAPVIPNGEAAAAILAAGIGGMVFGVVVVLAETYDSIANAISFSASVGPLSGKTDLAVGAWLAAWLVLFLFWKGKAVNFRPIFRITIVLVVLSFLLTLPVVFDAVKDVLLK